LGAVLAGFALLPRWEIQTSTLFIAASSGVATFSLLLAESSHENAHAHAQRRLGLSGCFFVTLLMAFDWSQFPKNVLIGKSVASQEDVKLVALSQGVNETVSIMEQENGMRRIMINGHRRC